MAKPLTQEQLTKLIAKTQISNEKQIKKLVKKSSKKNANITNSTYTLEVWLDKEQTTKVISKLLEDGSIKHEVVSNGTSNQPKNSEPIKQAEQTEDTQPKKDLTNTYYLTVRVENGHKVGWEVKRGNCERVSALCNTKAEAKEKVKELAGKLEASVIIYKMDGSIEETYKISSTDKK